MDYDAIIIGPGLGGCASGCVISVAGWKVFRLKRIEKIGGRRSGREKDGLRLDTGSHIFRLAKSGSFTETPTRAGEENSVEHHSMNRNPFLQPDTIIRKTAEEVTISGSGGDCILRNDRPAISSQGGQTDIKRNFKAC